MKLEQKYVILAMVVPMLALSGIVLAISGMNPITHYSGHGDPISGTYREGDLYTDLDTRTVWVYENHTWSKLGTLGLQDETEPTGIDGTNGANGIDGTNGTNGVDGTNGTNGNTWLWNSVDPTSDVGNDGDLYLNFATWDVFGKTDGTWSLLGNIKGEQGIAGINGANGTAYPFSVNGTDGVDGIYGTNEINELNGADGINGLNTTDGKDGTTGMNGAGSWLTIALLGVVGGITVATSVYAVRKKDEARAQARKAKILLKLTKAFLTSSSNKS